MPQYYCQADRVVNPLAHRSGIGYVSPMAYDMVAVILEARRRRKRVQAMRRKGMTFEEIARELDVTRQRAHAIWRESMRGNGKNGSGE